jgi:hypothetical protein
MQITCSKCGSEYEMECEKLPCRDKDVIFCEVCQEKLFSWNESKSWSAKLLKRMKIS